MESIKFNAKGHSVEFSKRTLTIDNQVYSYTGISQIKHSSAYHAYLFKYKGEWVKLFYEEPQGKTIAALFKRINAMNARRAMQARATQSIDTAAIAAALAGEEEKATEKKPVEPTAEKPAEPKVEETAEPVVEAEKPAEIPKAEEPVEPAPAEKPAEEKPAEKPVKEKKPKFWSRKKKAAAAEEKPAEEPVAAVEEPKVEPVEEPVAAEPVEEPKAEPVAVEPPTVEIPEEPVEVPGESVTVEPPTIEIPEESLPDAVEPKLELPEVEEPAAEAPAETVEAPAETTEAAAETKEPAAEAEEVLAKAEEAALKKSRLKKAFTIFAIIIALFVIAGIIYFFTIGTTNDSSQTVNTDETYQYNDIDELIEEMQE